MDITIITGAGSGIGRALTHHLANQGRSVLGVGRRPEPLAETRAHDPAHISVVSADVSTPEGHAAIVAAVPQGATVRYLVHNAAILAPVTNLADVTPNAWRKHMAINLEGPLFLTQALLPSMKDGSRVLHISSGAAHGAYRGWGAYCTSKAAFHMLYRCLDQELSERGIRVGSVRPGVVDTPMQDEVRRAAPEVFPNLARFEALKKDGNLASPETVAHFLAWFLTQTPPDVFAGEELDIRDMKKDGTEWQPV